MSVPDINDDALLEDDDALDYDLEKDEEDALLADPESYDNNDQFDEPAEDPEGDVLDIDATVPLEEEDQDQFEYRQKIKDEMNQGYAMSDNFVLKHEESDNENDEKQRNRFTNERNGIQRVNTNIPDSLESVNISRMNSNFNRNFRFPRGARGRGRGKPNRTPIFNRVGPVPLMENKTVLINPHFRGNVQVQSDTRLVWDNTRNQRFNGSSQGSYQNNFQPPVWNIQYDQPTFNPPVNQNFEEPPPPYQQCESNNHSIRPFAPVAFNQQPQTSEWHEETNYHYEHINQQEFHHRPNPPNLMNAPPPVFVNQQRNFPARYVYENARAPAPLMQKPFPNQHNSQMQQNFPVHQNFEPFNQSFQQNHENRQFPVQMNQPMYEQNNQYDQQNHYQQPPGQNFNQNYNQSNYGPSTSFGQNFGQNFVQTANFNPQFTRPPFNPNRTNAVRPNRPVMNFSPKKPLPKRRPFEKPIVLVDGLKKKRRSSDLTNLHEVHTVDTPDTTFKEEKPDETEDEETRAYRLKIEEQKRLRERVLRQKEERRKQAAQKTELNTPEEVQQGSNQLLTKVNEELPEVPKVTKSNHQMQKPLQIKQPPRPIVNRLGTQSKNNLKVVQNAVNVKKKAAQNPQNIVRVPQNPQRTVVNTQTSKLMITQKNDLASPQRIVMLKQGQKPANRRVILKGTEANIPESTSDDLNSFLSNRKVITKETTTADTSGDLIQTPVVTISNLAAGTTEVKLRKLCQGLGPIQNVEMIPNNRQATIRFKNIVSAHKFFKKYQRKIIDLSMIQVSLGAV